MHMPIFLSFFHASEEDQLCQMGHGDNVRASPPFFFFFLPFDGALKGVSLKACLGKEWPHSNIQG